MSKPLTALLVVLGLATGASAVPQPFVPGNPIPRSLTGRLLVATETMGDPRFRGTVLYMVRHDSTGALALIVNRPVGEMPVTSVLEGFGRPAAKVQGTIRVHYGGPVQPDHAFVLHTTDWTSPRSVTVRGGVAFTTDPAVIEAVARGAGPRRVLFALGYAGWAPGQLEAEMERDDWIDVKADEALVFDDDAASKWDRAMARREAVL